MALLFAYSWLTKKYAQQPPQQIATTLQDTSAPPVVAPSVVAPLPQQVEANFTIAIPVDAAPVDKHARFIASNDYLELTWRQYDGALVQAVWKQDGTHFFPKEVREVNGRFKSTEFIGIGGAVDSVFTGVPQVIEEGQGKAIVFSNQGGERLTYYLPNDSYILDVEWHSPSNSPMSLIRSLHDIPLLIDPNTGKQYPANPFQGLENGRVFTIEDKKIHGVTWDKILNDPWFSFLGRKRKEIPTATQRLGMDAGIEESKRQTTHYFAAIWDVGQTVGRATNQPPGFHTLPVQGNASARLYLGPKQTECLSTFHPLGQPEKGKPFLQVMDFGFFGMIAKFLFFVLRFIQSFIPNWGWALIVFGLLVRLSLWTLNTKTLKGSLRQKDLEPYKKKIQAKYEKYGNDKAKKMEYQRELMAFYKKNGHNQLGSCLPMLAQLPIFMALWSMLQNVFELRHAPWVFWIKDLSSADPYFILPAALVGTSIVQQAMTPAIGDPQQRKMMMIIMPIMMGFIFAYFPAGLTLYYLLFNVVGIGQQWWLNHNHKPQPVVV
jgi:YidC/Oxa1 family membrane protein insertase